MFRKGSKVEPMAKINIANLKKTIYYLQRNGLKNTCYAIKERMDKRNEMSYVFQPASAEELEKQRTLATSFMTTTFSIVVPTYCTKEEYLREMIDSCIEQTYSNWELILADATPDDRVSSIVQTYTDARIKLVKLQENKGIAENTNRGLEITTGEYVGLLDHDDVLEPNALYEVAKAIEDGQNVGIDVQMVYSDEDKCNGDRTKYYEPHYKENFNLDLILSNNYICHFLVLKGELIRKLGFRKEYDGAQDYDLVLRAVKEILPKEEKIVHISKVLYHWRCHEDSTAQNPQSKQYAYEAGRRALHDYAEQAGWKAKAEDTKHVGFYRLTYEGELWDSRINVGAVGGKVLQKGKILSGRMSLDGKVFYKDLPKGYSGYMHRASLQQTAEVLDIRCLALNPQCYELFEEIVGVPYKEREATGYFVFDVATLPDNIDMVKVSIKLSQALRNAGFTLVWDPYMICRVYEM